MNSVRNRLKKTVGLFLMTGSLMLALAEEPTLPAAKAEPDPAALTEVYRLLEVCQSANSLYSDFNSIMEAQFAGQPEMARLRPVFRKFFQKYITFDLLKREIAQIYLTHFTREEIRQLTAFYKSPVGKKLVCQQTRITIEAGNIASKVIQRHLGELQEMIRRECGIAE